jgi:hypothetical protein
LIMAVSFRRRTRHCEEPQATKQSRSGEPDCCEIASLRSQ